jgi:ribosomal protein S8
LQNPSQANGDNPNNAICETNRTSTNKKREYLKGKKLMSFKQTVGTKVTETYKEA